MFWLAISGVVFVSSVVQGTVGFGFGLLAIPLLLMLGIPLLHAVAMCLVVLAAQNALGCIGCRKRIPWRRLRRPILIRLATLPVGIGMLSLVGTLDVLVVKQIMGSVILFFVGLQLYCRKFSVAEGSNVHEIWEWLAAGFSGVLQGFCGMSGPPLVLWALSQRWSTDESRFFVFATSLSGAIPQGIFLYLAFGSELLSTLLLSILLLPAVFFGMLFGIRLGRALQGPKLVFATYAVLVFVAVSAITAPLVEHNDEDLGSLQGRVKAIVIEASVVKTSIFSNGDI